VLKQHCQLTIMAAYAIHQTSEHIKHCAETEATGSAIFGILASVSQTMETAAEQRSVSLFFRSPRRRRPRISVENAMSIADNLWEKQQKQREPSRGRPFCASYECEALSRQSTPLPPRARAGGTPSTVADPTSFHTRYAAVIVNRPLRPG
jgi:hypothetical protein